MPEGHAPGSRRKFQNRVARIGRAGFDHVRKRNVVGKAGDTDAAGIDHQAAVAKPDRARDDGYGRTESSDCVIPSASFSIASSGDILTEPSGVTVSSQ